MSRALVLLFLAASVLGASLVALSIRLHLTDDRTRYTAPGLAPMSIATAAHEAHRLAPALLFAVYEAFGGTGEAAVHDALAEVADGEALRRLYLEWAEGQAGDGLDGSSQLLHRIDMSRVRSAREGGRLRLDADWTVVGTVAHATHLHVRGNSYRAELLLEPVDGAWKIIGFELIERRRDRAGEVTDGGDE